MSLSLLSSRVRDTNATSTHGATRWQPPTHGAHRRSKRIAEALTRPAPPGHVRLERHAIRPAPERSRWIAERPAGRRATGRAASPACARSPGRAPPSSSASGRGRRAPSRARTAPRACARRRPRPRTSRAGAAGTVPPATSGSDGPGSSLATQRSPTFSNECFSDANAVRCARSPSPYVSTAASCVLDQVSCAFFGDRCSVPGSSSFAGMRKSWGDVIERGSASRRTALQPTIRADRARCNTLDTRGPRRTDRDGMPRPARWRLLPNGGNRDHPRAHPP